MNKKNESVLVSVLTPAYNAELFISEAIQSVLTQTYSHFEYIILDDCSTDSTLKIIEEFAKKDKRIKVIKSKKNLYIAGARNELLKHANGKYVMWQDADDISHPYRLEHQLAFLESHKNVGIVGGYIRFFNHDGYQSVRKYESSDDELRRSIFRFSPVAQPAAMIRREVYEKVGNYNLQYPPAEDIDMSFRIGEHYQFANLAEIVLDYRENNNSATFQKEKKIELMTIEIRKKFMNSSAYNMSFIDKLYNLLQYISIFIISPKLKIKLFNFFRNSKT